jgi:DNA-binding NarL/FixJ family response regulator
LPIAANIPCNKSGSVLVSITVLIADDHPLVRDGLRLSIQRSGKNINIVSEAADGLEVLQIAQKHPVDVFMLDITMPRLNGLDAARELIRRYPAAKIIILSIHDSRSVVEEAMAAGVYGYLTKETASRNVVEAICEVHEGHFFLSPDVAHFMVEKALAKGRKIHDVRKSMLTTQERKVLQLIAEGRSAKEIASELGSAVNTIHAHRKSLMSKLGIHKGTDLVRFAIKEGIAKL